MIRRYLQALAVGVLTLATNAPAQPPSINELKVDYDFYLGGIWAGQLTVAADFGELTYKANAELKTTGIVAFFYDLAFEAVAAGRIGANGLSPDKYVSSSRDPKREQFVEIAFVGGTPVSSKVEPARKSRPWSINPRDQHGTVDPLSAVLASFSPAPADAVCEQRVEVFDGRRKFAVEIGRRQRERNQIRCDAQYVRLAGFKPKWMGKNSTRDFTLFLRQRDDGLYEVRRAVGDTSFGSVVLLLRD